MIRIFVKHPLDVGNSFQLCDEQAHYLIHVMRLKEGQNVHVFNGADGLFEGVLAHVTKKACALSVGKKIEEQPIVSGADLYFALVKKEALETIVQKATELGVRNLYPIITARSVVHKMNVGRMQSIVVEACEQSERLTVPVVHEPIELRKMLALFPIDQKLIYLNERGSEKPKINRADNMAFIVGPEGGFTPEELELLAKHPNSVGVNLGKQILRADTACIAVLASYQFDLF